MTLPGLLFGSGSIHSDIDSDGQVGFCDFLLLSATFNHPAADSAFNPADNLDSDGAIDFSNFLILVADFGNTSPDVGNDVGNGFEIVHGPDAPGDGDRNNPFRSLTVHPETSATILLGTERNGFVRSLDDGVTWTRHRSGLRHSGENYPEIWDIA